MMDAEERARLHAVHVPVRGDWCACGAKYPCDVASLLDALDAAEARIAAVEALCDGARAEAEGGGMTDVDTIWPSAILAALSLSPKSPQK